MDRASRFWAITCYFNPVGYEARLANYRTFREHLEVPLLTVEWSVDGRFALSDADADALIQIASPDLLWQKERLLDIGLRSLPDAAEHVAWLDCDVVFREPGWPQAASRELEGAPVVQLFDRCLFPGANEDPAGSGVESAESLVRLSRHAGADVAARLWGPPPREGPRRRRLAGLAWAGRREFLERHGLYDACVFGAGDRAFVCAAFGRHRAAHQAWLRTPGQRRHYYAWADPLAAEIAGRVGLVEGALVHLWHGPLEGRQHGIRHDAAERHAFDPATDIAIDAATGLWRWSSPKRDLHSALATFFPKRQEDAPSE